MSLPDTIRDALTPSSQPVESPETGSLGIDEITTAISNSRRRTVIKSLADTGVCDACAEAGGI